MDPLTPPRPECAPSAHSARRGPTCARRGVPQGARRGVPQGARRGVPQGARRGVPQGARRGVPQGARRGSPDPAAPPTEGARRGSPDPAAPPTEGLPSPPTPFSPLWLPDLARAAARPTTWLWHGYLAAGNITVLSSQWKAGKTTLVSALLSKLHAGGSLAGLALAPAKAAVVSEESPAQWFTRSQKFLFGPHVCWLCRPFRGKPAPDQWLALIDHLATLRRRHGIDLAVIDPLSHFLPGRDENSAALMLESLLPLQSLTATGLALLLLHHPGKRPGPLGYASRGSSALLTFADVFIEMHWFARHSESDRRRRLHALSRHEATPRQLVIELSADGTDYTACPTDEEEFATRWDRLRAVLEAAGRKLTRHEIRDAWPADGPPPDPVSLWRWLNEARRQGLVRRDGHGRKSHPHRYWITGQEARWTEDPWSFLPRPPPADNTQA